MFGRKKKEVEIPVWEMQAEYDRMREQLDKLWPGSKEHSALLADVIKLEERKRNFEEATKPPEKRKISPDGWLAAGVTAICGLAPYAIEKSGHLANHLKGRVSTPNVWKNVH